jgi:hypothetical protein
MLASSGKQHALNDLQGGVTDEWRGARRPAPSTAKLQLNKSDHSTTTNMPQITHVADPPGILLVDTSVNQPGWASS